MYFLQTEFLSNLRLLWKTEGCLNLLYRIYIFLSFRSFEQLALALKNRVAQKFFAVWNILLTFRIFEQLALALKNRVALIFFTVLNIYFLLFRIFEQLAKNRVPWNFLLSGIYFYILSFWATCACPKNRGFPEFTVLNKYFL